MGYRVCDSEGVNEQDISPELGAIRSIQSGRLVLCRYRTTRLYIHKYSDRDKTYRAPYHSTLHKYCDRDKTYRVFRKNSVVCNKILRPLPRQHGAWVTLLHRHHLQALINCSPPCRGWVAVYWGKNTYAFEQPVVYIITERREKHENCDCQAHATVGKIKRASYRLSNNACSISRHEPTVKNSWTPCI